MFYNKGFLFPGVGASRWRFLCLASYSCPDNSKTTFRFWLFQYSWSEVSFWKNASLPYRKCKMQEYEKTWQQCYFGVQYILVRKYFISWMNKHSRNVIHNEMYYVYSIWYIWVACFWFEFRLLWFQWLVNRWALVYRYGWIRIDPLQTKRMLRTVVHNYPNLHEMPVARGMGLGK